MLHIYILPIYTANILAVNIHKIPISAHTDNPIFRQLSADNIVPIILGILSWFNKA